MSTSQIIDEMRAYLMHYGVGIEDGAPGRGSGRYPLGSGENPYQHGAGDFLDRVNSLKKDGLSEKEIARALGITTTELRNYKSMARSERRTLLVAQAEKLRAEGKSYNEIAKIMGFNNDSSVRSLLNDISKARMNKAKDTANFLKDMCDEVGMIDVGVGVEAELGISKEKLREALKILEDEGYVVYGGGIPQAVNPGQQTNQKVLCPPGTEHKDIYKFDDIHTVTDYRLRLREDDDGEQVRRAPFEYPASFDSKRLMVRYGDEGGKEKDGVIELRRGVDDISLGDSHYAQVRILVDNTHYLKGMAIYSDDMPDGIDIIFNTNKKSGTPALGEGKDTVLKHITQDPENPFGSYIKEDGGQSYYTGKDGKKHLSVINKRSDEGDWGDWADTLPSQFLAKQPMTLINKQLDLAIADKQAEFDDICALTNPTVKKNLLRSFAETCDSASVHLKAAALPRQKYQVILPLTSIKETEVYAPNYKDGEKVALIRYPHAGTFEIPILTVNNKQKEGKAILGTNPKDAIGISSKVAERLSGADFDGDTVMVIPINGKIKITSTPQLKGLKDFDPKMAYPERPGMKYMNNTQTEMGIISNLITDMTLIGANEEDITKAVKHSMVVIDAEKHNLDYKRSEIENDISELKKRYQRQQDGRSGGAVTLISKAKGRQEVDKREGSPQIDRETGKQTYKTARDSKLYYTDPDTGKQKKRTQVSTKMAETDDAMTLVSPARTPQELAYANYANKMKTMANEARKEMLATPNIQVNPSAKETYAQEVNSLLAHLNIAKANAPKERAANRIAYTKAQAKKTTYIEAGLTKKEIKEELKKDRQRYVTQARAELGAERTTIPITDREWDAIQAGAISESRLQEILKYTDSDEIRKRATPRATNTLSQGKISKIKAMAASGHTNAEIADALNISASTVRKYL